MSFDRDLRDLLRATRAFARSPAENIQRELESHLEMAERHVREAEAHVIRLRRIVEWRHAKGRDPRLAEAFLATCEDTLALHRQYLAKLRNDVD